MERPYKPLLYPLRRTKPAFSVSPSAIMSQEVTVKILCSEVTCSICLDFLSPTTLACGHNFCHACLVSYCGQFPIETACPRSIYKVSILLPTIWALILPTSEGWKAESTLSLVRFELPNYRQPAVSRSSLQYCTLTTAPLWLI
uniref:RING-type domain-containing protein n=1 Tax=Naja naja TaxID=35670 RepID=A0A8C6VKE0_NAJNA